MDKEVSDYSSLIWRITGLKSSSEILDIKQQAPDVKTVNIRTLDKSRPTE